VPQISVIIPYYQRESGILRLALASALAQRLQTSWELDLIIVDDCSPSPVELELPDNLPSHVSIRVIARPNGGPAAARNTGLDAVSQHSQFIAFLDSDDQWAFDHLDRAVATLGTDADFYFSDQKLGELNARATHFRLVCAEHGCPEFECSGLPTNLVARDPANPAIFRDGPSGSYAFSNNGGLTTLLRSFLSHMSTTVIRTERLGHIRFRTDLRAAGEDYLYFLQLASLARKVCYSRHAGVERGRGVSIYQYALSWSDPRSLPITLDNYRCFLLARKELKCNDLQTRILDRRLAFRRLELAARLISELKRTKSLSPKIIGRMVRADPTLIPRLPFLYVQALVRRALKKPITDHERASELP
jgi:succinoglycan biosynthesis protein ExoW